MAGSFNLTIFRHGLTLENEKSQYLGWTDAPLSKQGRKDTEKIARLLDGWQADQIITSDLLRCQETSGLLFPNQDFQTNQALREMNFGSFEGKTYGELKNQKDYQLWLDDIFQLSPPGGESFDVFSERVKKGMVEITQSLSTEVNDLVLVVHGGVLRLLLSTYVASSKKFFDWKIPNSQGYQLTWENKESFRRLEKCISLSEVPSTAKGNG